jgi:two-component system sensor histidine kinase QseC
MVEDFHERAINSRYILLSIWIPLGIIYLIFIATIKYLRKSQAQQINSAVDYFRKYNLDIDKAKNITIPNIPKLKPIIDIVEDLAQNFHKISKRQKHFIADASHQLRTPLTIIKLQVEQLAKNQNVDVLSNSVNRMIKLTNQLLSLTKFESGNLKQEKVLWHDLVFNISSEWIDIAFKHNIDFGFENNMGNQTDIAYVNVDRLMIEEAINNLIENAIKYRKDYKNQINTTNDANDNLDNFDILEDNRSIITVVVGCTSGTVWAKVIDNGIGIPVKYRHNLFNRFFRADNNVGTKGSGLGLAIVQEIMQANRGFVRLLNEDDTTFLLVLPRLNNSSKQTQA